MKKLLLSLGILALTACGHKVQKAEVSGDPAQEIQRLERDIESAQSSHADVLAPEEFRNAQKMLTEAKEDLREGDSQSEILDSLGYGRGYLNRAIGLANGRRSAVEGILKMRDKALQAGARKHPAHTKTLGEIDDDLRDEMDNPSAIPAADVSKYQSRYSDLELASLKSTHLGDARSKIQNAIDNRAENQAPRSLRQAQVDLTSAENAIASNRNEPSEYKTAVNKANESAQLLIEVLSEIRKANVSEDTAFGIVQNKRKVAGLQSELSDVQNEAEKREQELRRQGKTLSEARRSVEFQKAIDAARQEFTEDEAEVFQQGDKLIIRLKTMNFPINRADLPPQALALLAKVKAVADELDPREIVVEGHTDSTGSATLNDKLSQARAEAVAHYLETSGLDAKVEAVGYGFEKPLASNKTKEGRAQNRRVDVVVTPSATTDDEELMAPTAE